MSEDRNGQNHSETKKGGRNKGVSAIIIIVGVIIIALLLVVIGILLSKQGREASQETEATKEVEKRSVVVTKDNVDEVVEEMTTQREKPVEAGYYSVSMSTGWHFPDSKSAAVDAVVKNREENTHDVYFDLFLADDLDNPIYQSPVISLGAELTDIVLDKELDDGIYECVMIYHLVDEDQNTVDTVHFAQTIQIGADEE